ncbi:MAG: hypothetical protein F6K28_11960 [Microcoleus sp. SIO2G3]|nr:hypothetical protein [Microcoleus sp. SIO2G3]
MSPCPTAWNVINKENSKRFDSSAKSVPPYASLKAMVKQHLDDLDHRIQDIWD